MGILEKARANLPAKPVKRPATAPAPQQVSAPASESNYDSDTSNGSGKPAAPPANKAKPKSAPSGGKKVN